MAKAQIVDEGFTWGVYLWQLPDGHLFHDGDGNFLSVAAHKDDFNAIKEIGRAAAYYGKPEGKPYWHGGGRQVSDEEYSEQLDRLREGEIPSLNDIGAVAAAKRGIAEHGE